jgi:RsiW-degrading membrane proteinase PrsW (M82 family)
MFRLLFWAAVIPPLFLMWKVYQLDKIEKEPIGLLAILFALGAVSCFPAAFVETLLGDRVLAGFLDPTSVLYQIINCFLIIAGAEEGFKYLVLKKVTWKNKDFDYRFDAVVYSVAVTLGFAAFENVMYVFQGGLGVAASRAVLSIPGHCIFGIYMGFYYGTAKMHNLMGHKAAEKSFLRRTVFHPMLLHGFYDFCLFTNNNIMLIIFFIYVIILDIIAFNKVRKLAREDHLL